MAVLAEAARISRSLSAPLCLIHADEFTREKEDRFRSALRDLQLESEAAIRFEPGEPAEAILKVQREEKIDLLVAGAMETQSVHRNFTGDVARELLRRAPCDLLLYTEPKEDPQPPQAILVVVPDLSKMSRQVLCAALNLAERRGGRLCRGGRGGPGSGAAGVLPATFERLAGPETNFLRRRNSGKRAGQGKPARTGPAVWTRMMRSDSRLDSIKGKGIDHANNLTFFHRGRCAARRTQQLLDDRQDR